MANDSAQDQNLPASARKLAKAREEGQVVRSRDLGHFTAIGGGGVAIAAIGPQVATWLQDALAASLRFDRATGLGAGAMGQQLAAWTTTLLWAVLPFGAAMTLVGVLGNLAIGGWVWTAKPFGPKFAFLDPVAGLGRVFSKQQVGDALKASVLALVLGTIGALYLRDHLAQFTAMLGMPLPAAVSSMASTIVGGVLLLLLALALFAAIDVPWQMKLHADKLKMSRQDLKQEQKELEGNAEVKSKVKARMREMTQRRMMAAVPKADLVVMNPTHYAVALKYDDKSMGAPRVVAKGADLIALKIRDLAKDSKVPVLEAPVLARALFAHAEVDREIPAALFAAVAQVLAYVYQLRAAMSGKVPMPGELPPLDVPAELDPHAA